MGSKTHQKNLQDNAKEIKALIKRSSVKGFLFSSNNDGQGHSKKYMDPEEYF